MLYCCVLDLCLGRGQGQIPVAGQTRASGRSRLAASHLSHDSRHLSTDGRAHRTNVDPSLVRDPGPTGHPLQATPSDPSPQVCLPAFTARSIAMVTIPPLIDQARGSRGSTQQRTWRRGNACRRRSDDRVPSS